MANRIATLADQATYATVTNGALKEGDGIWDTPTSTVGGTAQLFSTSLASLFSGIRFGGHIWFDCAVLPPIHMVQLGNGGTLWSANSDFNNPITFRTMGGMMDIDMTANSHTARMVLLNDFAHFRWIGGNPSFSGMKYGWQGGLGGKFGVRITGGTVLNEGSFQLMMDAIPGAELIDIRGIEFKHGFCGVRAIPGNTDLTITKFHMEQLLCHQIIDGEGLYIGQTTGTPFAKFQQVEMRDVIMANCAAESMQLQHLIMNVIGRHSYQKNFVAFASAMAWKRAFQNFQSNNVQYVCDEGKNTMKDFIIDSCGDSLMNVLSGTTGTPTIEPVIVKNGYVGRGRRIGMYFGVNTGGVNWEFRNLDFVHFVNNFNELDETAVPTYVVSKNGTDKTSWLDCKRDNTKSSFFEDAGVTGIEQKGITVDNAVPVPDYSNPGFPGRVPEQLEQWTEEYPSWSVRVGDKTSYLTNDIVLLWREGFFMRYYNCILGHTSSAATRPDIDPTHWTLVTWDTAGVPSYDGAHNAGTAQSYDPPWDMRLTADSYHNLLGRGLSMNHRNTNTTTFQWFIYNNDETNERPLAGQCTRILEISPEDRGNGYKARLKMYFKEAGGSITEVWVGGYTVLT